jgi:Zn-dependent metalloprotease
MKTHTKIALATLALCASTPFAFAAPSTQLTLDQLRQQHPKLRTMTESGKVTKMVAPEMATGKTAEKAAQNFLRTWSHSLGVNASDFIAEGPFADGHHVQPIMYNRETGEYKFTGVYFKQTIDGLPVYGSRLMVLSRNVDNNPIVNAEVNLRDVQGFKRPKRLMNNNALALMAAATRFGTSVTTTTPELMVYAGSKEEHAEPRAALVYEAKVGGGWDSENYQKAELIVDAETGEILHEKNLILHADGNIGGQATTSSGADVCEPEAHSGMPYAKVTLNGNTAYADADGNYSISGEGNLTSKLEGQWFDVNNHSGSDASITQNTLDPNIVHNSANNSESYRAQVNAYLQSNIVRDYALYYFPDFPTIDTQTSFPANVGVSGTCNAFYDYSSINFYNAGGGCSNTAFSVVVHHEYGHHMVASAGSGQGQYGEGMGDVMGVLITGDNQLARGFYSNDCTNGIRNADNNKQYPCTGGIHDCGQLISGCVWDAIIEMEAAYGSEGREIVASLAINSMVMHSGDNISPSITLDWLTLDDDDGDLSNGTPHSVEILAGFALHNMDEIPEPLDNDDCVTARAVIDGTHSITTVGALDSNDPYDDGDCGGTYLGDMHADVWYSYTACESGSMIVSTCDIVDFDSDIVVYQGTCDNKTQIACNGDGDNCGGYSSETTFNVTQGSDYLIRVGGWSGSSEGSGQLLIDGPGEPCDTTPPCTGDIDEDGTVGVADLLAIVDMWGQSGGAGDIDEDGTVGVGDLLLLIDAWGACPE